MSLLVQMLVKWLMMAVMPNPAAYEQVSVLNTGSQGAFEHRPDQLRGLADLLLASLGPQVLLSSSLVMPW